MVMAGQAGVEPSIGPICAVVRSEPGSCPSGCLNHDRRSIDAVIVEAELWSSSLLKKADRAALLIVIVAARCAAPAHEATGEAQLACVGCGVPSRRWITARQPGAWAGESANLRFGESRMNSVLCFSWRPKPGRPQQTPLDTRPPTCSRQRPPRSRDCCSERLPADTVHPTSCVCR
jgi:hypothetical protein